MSQTLPVTREETTLAFSGPAVETHEIEVSLLSEALVAYRSLAERACRQRYGKDVDLIVKVKAFRGGSFNIDLILDWSKNNPEAAIALAGLAGGTVVGIVKGFIRLCKWAKGKPVDVVEAKGEETTITNVQGTAATFNNCVITMYQSSATRNDAEKLTRPLEHGITSITLGEGNDAAIVKNADRSSFAQREQGVLREDEDIITLEIITPNLRGEPYGWRFYDGSVEYAADIEDADFLEKVKAKQIVFRSGDMLEARMKVIQRRPSQRLVTDRSLLEILSFIPSSSDDA
jgi:hypothetical protein